MKDQIVFVCYDCGKHHEYVVMDSLNDALEHIKTGAIVHIRKIEYQEYQGVEEKEQ